jgi:hypothetical protein
MDSNRAIVHLTPETNTCFVVMPFDRLHDTQYERVIKKAIEAVGLVCKRGDEIYSHSEVLQDIWREIRSARLILAELSGKNANVMYEIGLAHAIGKPIILLTRNEQDVPFDLRALRYIYYDPNNPFWGPDLLEELIRIIPIVLANPTQPHLQGIEVERPHPAPFPVPFLPSPDHEIAPVIEFDGEWEGSWLSVRRNREHKARLIIPKHHGTQFTSYMIVTFDRNEQQTTLHETLTSTVRGRNLSLRGVSYTYLVKGSSSSYSLDAFELTLSEDGSALVGTAVLRHGTQEIKFTRARTIIPT